MKCRIYGVKQKNAHLFSPLLLINNEGEKRGRRLYLIDKIILSH